MQVPLQVSFRNMPPSPAVEADIRDKAAKLEEFYDRITSVRVVVETAHRQHRQGKLFHVRIDVRVPGRELVVRREPAEHRAHEDVHVAVRDAFDAAKRQLEDYVRETRGNVKTHDTPLRAASFGWTQSGATVSSPRPIRARTISIGTAWSMPEFDQLRVGDEVRFAEGLGEKGPQVVH